MDWWRPVDRNGVVSTDNDKSRPSPVRFVWTIERGTGACDLLISRNRDFQDALVVRGVIGGQCEVFHLHIGTRYYWKVTARDADGRVVESPVRSFVTHDAPPRWIWVPEITNVRDMGGWPLPGGNRRVRQGMLYRSSEMNSHLTITEAGERLLVHELKIRTDLDLRCAPEEVKSVLDASHVEWVNIPIGPYGSIVDDNWRDAYRRVFALLAQERRYPVLFHCWGGADRGGTLAFLIHGLLGVKLPDLVHDYELTSLSVWGPRSQASVEFKALRAALRPFGQRANDIKGQVEGYLRAIGVTARDIAAIRALLTLDAGGRRC
jgi:protein-tyrosine phosphatase